MCAVIGYSRQSYYKGTHALQEESEFERRVLLVVRELRYVHPRMGTKKLATLLEREGITCGRDWLFALLRRERLLVPHRRCYARTTDSRHAFYRHPDLAKNLMLVRPNQLWVADITYVRVRERFYYLALLTDAYSRYVVGYDVSESLGYEGALRALTQSFRRLGGTVVDGLMHHSDRGVQYCCHAYVAKLRAQGMTISMTETGSPYDNAKAERVNGILKYEYGLKECFESEVVMRRAVKQAIQSYNEGRPHLSLGMKTPRDVHYGPMLDVSPGLMALAA